MSDNLYTRPESAGKISLGYSELLAFGGSGTYASTYGPEMFGLVSCSDGTIITEMEFVPDRTETPIAVTRYNGIAVVGSLLIGPVFNREPGYWSKVVISAGQVAIYGREERG